MYNPSEQSLGREIFQAQASLLPRRYSEDEKYRLIKLERYSQQIEDFKVELKPSSLTAYTLQRDWALRRLRYATHSNTLPYRDILYLGDAAMDIYSMMTTIIMLTTFDGVQNPWAKLAELEKQKRLSDQAAENFMDFIDPIRPNLQQGGDDSRLIDLLHQASLRFRHTSDQSVPANDREGLIYQAYRGLYPTSAQFLAERRPNSRPIARPLNWF